VTQPGPRNPRTERTRAALIAAGRRLFSERPVDAVTVDDIVQAAEVGKELLQGADLRRQFRSDLMLRFR
jgi:AcrR family transcriptional regulator